MHRHLAIFPGEKAFSIVSLTDGNGGTIEPARWSAVFDLSLAGAGDRYTGCADLVDVARHGHFTDSGRPWERITFDHSQV